MAKKEKPKYTSIAGQALMEGIMMRGPYKSAMVVRRADGSLVIEDLPLPKNHCARRVRIHLLDDLRHKDAHALCRDSH